jgi:acetyl esterase
MPSALARLHQRLETSVFLAAMALPPRVTRRLAGPPKRLDGMTLSPQTQLMLRLQRWARERPVESLPIEQGRLALTRQATMVGGRQPVGEVVDTEVAGAEGPLRARLYVPRGAAPTSPLLVFFHGGGMVYGDLDSHDPLCRFLAEQAGVRVLAVDYRLAPEAPFPAAVDDAWAAFEHVARHPEQYGADPTRLAVGGDSAGGCLSATTAIRAATEGVPLAYQLLIYPVTDLRATTRSRELFGRGLFLTAEFIELATGSYLGDADPRDPRASVMYADLPAGLAPAFVATAGFDPLRDEGEAYARKLADAGVAVQHKRYGGEIHGFANMVGTEGTPRRAMTEMAEALQVALRAQDPAVA